MSLRRLWVFLAIALPVVASLLASLSSVDLTYQLRAGDEILRTGTIPSTDAWTFTAPGAPWFDQQWGAQVLLELVERIGGWTGLGLLRAVLVGVIFGSIAMIGLRRGLAPRTTALLTLATFAVAAPALALRPQLFGMALFACVLVLVSDRARHPARMWAIPALVVLWANMHGSFFLAPVVLGLAWLADVADRVRTPHRTLLIAVVTVATACLTPFGPMVWAYAVGLATNPEVTRRITEWQPTTIRDGTGLLFFGSVAAVAIVVARRGRPTAWPTLAWLGLFAGIGLYAQRGLAWWPLAAAVGVLDLLPAADDKPERATPSALRRLNVVVAGALVLAAIALLPAWRPLDPGTRTPVRVLAEAPSGVTAALRDIARAGDHVFNPQPWGSWFEYAVPDVRVALDSRIEFFPTEVWDAYEGVVAGADGWERQLADWDVAIVVVQARDEAFAARLADAGWQRVYADEDGTVFRSDTSSVRALQSSRYANES